MTRGKSFWLGYNSRMSVFNQLTIGADDNVIRPTIAEINLNRISENYRAIQTAVAPAAIMPILKANAYGHGLVEIARHMVSLGAPYLGVAFWKKGFCCGKPASPRPSWFWAASWAIRCPLF